MIVNLLLILVFLAIALVLAREGLWSGLVMLLNIVAAATFATAWYERLASFVDAKLPSYTYSSISSACGGSSRWFFSGCDWSPTSCRRRR